ncbi:hypothetical protein [Stenotrophomonas sp. TWI1183]
MREMRRKFDGLVRKTGITPHGSPSTQAADCGGRNGAGEGQHRR